MSKIPSLLFAVTAAVAASCTGGSTSGGIHDTLLVSDTIQYHPVRIDKSSGAILPWFSPDKGTSYDTVLMLLWDFWNKMEVDSNGLKYYMNHQVWRPEHDMRGLGGDQVNMALSSWRLFYAYSGKKEVLDNMRYIADTYLERSLSEQGDAWPYIPYPYNTDVHSGRYDGDMRNGKDITQPDKAGSFGYELVKLFDMTGEAKYLEAAIRIANTLAANVREGGADKSPLPFRVNAKTGEAGVLFDNSGTGKKVMSALYTANWTGTMMLFGELLSRQTGDKENYQRGLDIFLRWMKDFPLKTNKWGPFFEDIPGWSDTQTNAISFAMYILEHRNLFPDWKQDVRGIIDWTYRELGNHEYDKYRVTVMNEQTVYRVPGNSHSSRQASVELLYSELSGDTSLVENAIRTLSWATYTVAPDGRNRYIRDDIWLTDGYGDYVRHYIRAMAAYPSLAPSHRNRFLATSSVVREIEYGSKTVSFTTASGADDIISLASVPVTVRSGGRDLKENQGPGEDGFRILKHNGCVTLYISHKDNEVEIRL